MFAILIPTSSDHDRNKLPVVTMTLIGINVLVYLVTSFLLDSKTVSQTFGFVAADPKVYQFFTHMFLHLSWPQEEDAEWQILASLLHIGGNMAYLWFAGSDLEDVLGHFKFLVLYLLGGIFSAALFWVMAVGAGFEGLNEPAVGASGAISGLLGFYAVRFPRFKIRMYFAAIVPFPFLMRQGIARISSLFFIGFWIGLQLLFGIQSLRAGGAEVAYWGHIGGFLLGLVMGLATQQWREGQEEFLVKEAEHLFFRQKWYRASEVFARITELYPRCADAVVKLALCWELTGERPRAEKLLREAAESFTNQGWKAEADLVRSELETMNQKSETHSARSAAPELADAAPSAAQNVMFRREVKWKGKRLD